MIGCGCGGGLGCGVRCVVSVVGGVGRWLGVCVCRLWDLVVRREKKVLKHF